MTNEQRKHKAFVVIEQDETRLHTIVNVRTPSCKALMEATGLSFDEVERMILTDAAYDLVMVLNNKFKCNIDASWEEDNATTQTLTTES